MINPENNRAYDLYIKRRRLSLKITVIYLIVGSLWIVFSDRILLSKVSDMQSLALLETIKGWFYVVVTSFMIYGLIRRDEVIYEEAVDEILKNYQEMEATYEELRPQRRNWNSSTIHWRKMKRP